MEGAAGDFFIPSSLHTTQIHINNTKKVKTE